MRGQIYEYFLILFWIVCLWICIGGSFLSFHKMASRIQDATLKLNIHPLFINVYREFKRISIKSDILSHQHTFDNRNLRAHVLLNMETCRRDPRCQFRIRFLSPPTPIIFPQSHKPLCIHISENEKNWCPKSKAFIEAEFRNLKNEHWNSYTPTFEIFKIYIHMVKIVWMLMCVRFNVKSNFNHICAHGYTHMHTITLSHRHKHTQA